jgi:hypothetical protein
MCISAPTQMFFLVFFCFFFWHKVKIQLQESNQNTTKHGRTIATGVEIKNVLPSHKQWTMNFQDHLCQDKLKV